MRGRIYERRTHLTSLENCTRATFHLLAFPYIVHACSNEQGCSNRNGRLFVFASEAQYTGIGPISHLSKTVPRRHSIFWHFRISCMLVRTRRPAVTETDGSLGLHER